MKELVHQHTTLGSLTHLRHPPYLTSSICNGSTFFQPGLSQVTPTFSKLRPVPRHTDPGRYPCMSTRWLVFHCHQKHDSSFQLHMYASVQIDAQGHSIDLNFALVYCNHSCAPSLEFDKQRFEVRVARGRDLNVGDALTIFYSSSEWVMDQPFPRTCGTSRCYGWFEAQRFWTQGN